MTASGSARADTGDESVAGQDSNLISPAESNRRFPAAHQSHRNQRLRYHIRKAKSMKAKVRDDLKRLWDRVADEPVPQDMLDLLAKLK